MKKNEALIIGNHTQALGIVRSLGSNSILTNILYDGRFSLSRFSKYLSRFISVERGIFGCLEEEEEKRMRFSNILLDINFEKKAVIFATNEDIIYAIDLYSDGIRKKYFWPENDLGKIYDKYRFYKTILGLGLHTPKTLLLSEAEIDDFIGKPYILKARRGNYLRNLFGRKCIDLSVPRTKKYLSCIKRLPPEHFLIQKKTPEKEVVSFCSFALNGEPINIFMYKKIRQHPDSFGTGTYLQSIFSNTIYDHSKKILTELKYTGISEIEFIYDDELNDYSVIEMNPRTWKSIDFATKCGQNIALSYFEYLTKGKIKKSNYYEVGKYWVDLFTDIPQMFRKRRFGKIDFRNCYYCIYDPKDIRPFIFGVLLIPLLAFDL